MKTKRLLQLLCCVCAMLITSQNVNAQNVSEFFGAGEGDGTAADPYQITTGDQLNAMRNGGENKCYILMEDIDMGAWLADNSPTEGWQPIDVFRQTFDGNNKKLTGFWINHSGGGGLFWQLNTENDVPAIVKDLTIVLDETKGITGGGETGAIVGKVSGSEDNAFPPVQLINCHVIGSVTGGGAVGGLVGRAQGVLEIIDCSFQGKVSGNEIVGGIIGQKYEGRSFFKMTGSYTIDSEITGAWGKAGGLAGRIGPNSTFEGCYASGGSVTGTNAIGGLIGDWGHDSGSGNLKHVSSMKNCFTTNSVIGASVVGGLVGEIRIGGGDTPNDDATERPFAFDITQSYSAGSVISDNDIAGGLVGGYWNANECVMDACYSVASVTVNYGDIGGLIGKTDECKGIEVKNSYALNPVFSGGVLVGKVQRNDDPINTTFTNCAAFDELSGNNAHGETITFVSKEQAILQATYAGWDFASTWTFGNGAYKLPVLTGIANQPTIQPAHLPYTSTSIAEAQNNGLKYYVKDNTITLENVNGLVTLTSISGISQTYEAKGTLNIPVGVSGVYVLTVKDASYKIAVK